MAIAKARIASEPAIKVGIAYFPLGAALAASWFGGESRDFRQAVRALRNEFACKRGLVVRMYPHLFDGDRRPYSRILAQRASGVRRIPKSDHTHGPGGRRSSSCAT